MKASVLVRIAMLLVAAGLLWIVPALDSEDENASGSEGIQFYKGTWEQALQASRESNKPLFLDVYATWCGPCRKLKKTTFRDKKVGAFFNEHFINVAFDGEQSEGTTLREKFGLDAYPSLLFVDANGDVRQMVTGYQSPDELLQLGQAVSKK